MKKVELLYLSQEDILSLDIGWEEIIKRVEMAVSEQANDTIENPPKRGIHTRPDAFIHEMPVFLKKMDACGIKWVSGYPENYKHDLPQILGVQVMNCPETGVPTAVMDCRWITAVRTSAATAITAKYCAKKNSKKIAIIGAGVQGRMHLLAIKHVLPSLEECHIVDIKESVLDAIMEKLLKIIKSTGSLVLCTLVTSIITVYLSSSVYVSIILNGRMYDKAYRKKNLDIITLSRTITEGSAYFGGMCPWSGGGLLVISSLGVGPWSYLPYVFGCWGAIFFTILWGYTGKYMQKAEYDEDGKLISAELADAAE